MMDDHDSGDSEKLTFNRFRNALLLSYLALSGAALAYTYASLKSAEGLVVFLVFMGAIPLLAVIVVAYLCSLAGACRHSEALWPAAAFFYRSRYRCRPRQCGHGYHVY